MTNHTNTTPIKDILDNLIAVYDEAGKFGEPPIKSGFTIVGKEEAEQAIQTYIDNKILEARIDELRKIRNWKGTIFHDHIMDYCGDRIEELIKSNQSKGNDNE